MSEQSPTDVLILSVLEQEIECPSDELGGVYDHTSTRCGVPVARVIDLDRERGWPALDRLELKRQYRDSHDALIEAFEEAGP